MQLDLPTLKRLRNSVIGAPTAKIVLIQDGFLPHLLFCIHASSPLSTSLPLRIEATHVLASLCISTDCLPFLLRAGILRVLLGALRGLPHALPPGVFEEEHGDPGERVRENLEIWTKGLARSLASLVSCMNEAVYQPRHGLGKKNYEGRSEAAMGLEELVQTESMDCFLTLLQPPLVSPPPLHPPTSAHMQAAAISVADLLSSMRTMEHRTAILAWLPPSERLTAAKGKRGWERKEEGGWVTNRLIALLKSSSDKAQVAGMSALAGLLDNNPGLVTKIGRFHAPAAQRMYDLSRSSSAEVRLAACDALAAILRHPRSANKSLRTTEPDQVPPNNLLLNVFGVLHTLLEDKWNPMDLRVKACWVIASLVTDSAERSKIASEVGTLNALVTILRTFPPIDPTDIDELEEESNSLRRFREATLSTLAVLIMASPSVTPTLMDKSPSVLPIIHTSLSHPSALVRHSACQVIRGMTRNVPVLRSSLVDEGVVTTLLGLVIRGGDLPPDPRLSGVYTEDQEMSDEGQNVEEKGERRVLIGALMALINLASNFSPAQNQTIRSMPGALDKIYEYAGNRADGRVRREALWVLKHLIFRERWEVKLEVAQGLGLQRLRELFQDDDTEVRAQAITILQNMACNHSFDIQQSIETFGADFLLKLIEDAVATGNDILMIPSLELLHNIVPVLTVERDPPSILDRSLPFLSNVLDALSSPNSRLRFAAARAVHTMLRESKRCQEMRDVGIERKMREMLGSEAKEGRGRGTSGRRPSSVVVEVREGEEESSDVRDQCKNALKWFDAV